MAGPIYVTENDITYRDLFGGGYCPEGKTDDDVAIPAFTMLDIIDKSPLGLYAMVKFYGIEHTDFVVDGLSIRTSNIMEL